MALSEAKVPAIIATGLICLALGVGGGVGLMMFSGWKWEPKPPEDPAVSGNPMAMMGKGGPGAGGPGGGGPGKGFPGKGGPGKGGKGKAASPKTQLVSLVEKLDLLTEKPLAVKLTAEQKKEVREQLKGLDDDMPLSDDDAKKRIDGLVKALAEHKDVLTAAGFPWPGEAAPQPPGEPPNPFMAVPHSKRLKALEERLAK
jgi:hypothetical protein